MCSPLNWHSSCSGNNSVMCSPLNRHSSCSGNNSVMCSPLNWHSSCSRNNSEVLVCPLSIGQQSCSWNNSGMHPPLSQHSSCSRNNYWPLIPLLMQIMISQCFWPLPWPYCTISINSAITRHRPSGFGWNWLLVPRHKLSGWLENPKGRFGASHRIQAPHTVAKIWCPSQAHQRLADAKILASRSQVTPLDELIKIVQYSYPSHYVSNRYRGNMHVDPGIYLGAVSSFSRSISVLLLKSYIMLKWTCRLRSLG